jgi:hypothetical protein
MNLQNFATIDYPLVIRINGLCPPHTNHSLDGMHLKNMMPLHCPLLNQCDQKLVDEDKPSANMMEL